MVDILALAILLQSFHAVCVRRQHTVDRNAEFGYVPLKFPVHEYVDTHDRVQPTLAHLEFEPIIPKNFSNTYQLSMVKNINCEDFSTYTFNCTVEAASMYNSDKKAPPMPGKIYDWCRAIKHLTNCAIDWNSDCKDVTESHFHDESIRGHMHVAANICDSEAFLIQYDSLPECIERISTVWEDCYKVFKMLVEEQKSATLEWTHFETHFHLCCARTRFRRCTLDLLFGTPLPCSYEQAVQLQKFSVIVSEGDVFQDCERNVMYKDCPGGDPRPSANMLLKLTNPTVRSGADALDGRPCFVYTVLFIILLFFNYSGEF